MNRLVIVGNGFDLAHGVESGYSSFLIWLLNKELKNSYDDIESIAYKELFTVEKSIEPKHVFSDFEVKSIHELHCKENIRFENDFSFLRSRVNRSSQHWKKTEDFLIIIKSQLFNSLLYTNGWADIERSYFDLLIKIYNNDPSNSLKSLDKLNADLELIKLGLIEYLEVEEKRADILNGPLNKLLRSLYFDTFYSNFNSKIAERHRYHFSNLKEVNVFYLTFNYTNVLKRFLAEHTIESEVIPIHGTLLDAESVIFGYGDDSNKYNNDLEELNIDEYLKNFKSNYYANNENYLKLLELIGRDLFDVVVIGHSLGLSDRVLFRTIFEHDNCKFIHLSHTGGDSHMRKRIALSRHFGDKTKFRGRLYIQGEHLKFNRNERN